MPGEPEPLSWLTLERYALGELTEPERADVEARLARSEADRACLAEIMADQSELPPLPLPIGSALAQGKRPSVARANRALRPARPWLGWSAALCAAAAALLVVLNRPDNDRAPTELSDHVKGADVTLRLISDQRGADPAQFSAGERFKVEITCPPALSGSLRVFVLQGEEIFEPLPRDARFRCGNLAPFPGAFALDGSEPADVCAYWGTVSVPTKKDFEREATCRRLMAP
jgi:hypothetical protein